MLPFVTKVSPQLTALALALAASSFAHASIVASWDLSGDPGNQATEPAAFQRPGIVGSPMIRGAGLGPVAAANSFNSNNWDDEIDEYIEFGFTVGPGTSVDLQNLIIATRSTAAGPGTIGLFTSLDSFAAPVYTFAQSPGGNFVNNIVDLSSLPLLGPGTFAVRLYEIGDTQADGVGDTDASGTFLVAELLGSEIFDDIQFNGTIVPEFNSFIVWALLGVCGYSTRRRS